MTERDLERVLNQSVQDVHLSDAARRRIRQATKEERPVTSKKFVAIVLAVMLTLTASVGIAAELGLFGLIAQRENADVRLPALDMASTPMEKVFTTPEGVTVTIHQAFYDGSRVFVSYAVAGPTKTVELGEGKPDIVNYDWKKDNVIYANEIHDNSEAGKQMASWLDGSVERWGTLNTVYVGDNMDMADGTNMNIIGGGDEDIYQEDGSYINWKECEVPPDKAADEIAVCLGVFTNERTYYQTEDSLYYSYGGITQRNKFEFTVKKADVAELTGSGKGAEWTAEANLTVSAIDMKGEIIVKGPDGWTEIWTNWENPGNLDYINDWNLYVNGAKLDSYNLDGSVWTQEGGKVAFGICYKLDGASTDLKLVPVYRYAGEKLDEAITLK